MTAEPPDQDPVSYLIAEFEAIVLQLAGEIDRLRARVGELEAAAGNAAGSRVVAVNDEAGRQAPG